MQTIIIRHASVTENIQERIYLPEKPVQKRLSALERKTVWTIIRMRIFFIALLTLKSMVKTWHIFRTVNGLRNKTWGGKMNKIYRVAGKYYFNLYTPGWPSPLYDQLIRNEVLRFRDGEQAREQLRFIFLAITRKCPLRCEHCFEWDNLNKKETFTREELIRIVDIYQKEGVNQIHFSGGEPMARFRDLLEVVRFAAVKSECYVLTSGFNLTLENARLLISAGCKGMIVSIDHYIPEMHNRFRQHPRIFNQAVEGVKASLQAGMVTALSVCATREFLEGAHLEPYLEFAKSLGVHFMQVLEPKAVGHYEGKDVLLEEKHIQILEAFFKKANHERSFADYPTVMYHGFHQRRIGCYAGSRSVYIDSAGNVHDCPFCHTHAYNIRAILDDQSQKIPVKVNECPRYGKVV